MKIAIISDLHLGDPKSCMANQETTGPGYDRFRSIVKNRFNGPLDYLVLLGDVMDFAVSRYQEAYQAGKIFFNQLIRDDIAGEIIYIPGNHDFDLWQIVEYEVNIIKKIARNKPIRLFRYSVPAIFDDRSQSKTPSLTLRNVSANTERSGPKYAGLFLDSITVADTGKETHFNFAFPNMYLVTDSESILITHGQYLEGFWSLTGELALRIFAEDLILSDPGRMDLAETVGINSPLSQLSSSGSGQAGPLTERIQAIEHMVYEKNTKRLGDYLDRLVTLLKSYTGFLGRLALSFVNLKKIILKKTAQSEEAQYSVEFVEKSAVRDRCLKYYLSSLLELEEMKKDKIPFDIPLPQKIIFGHTHLPIGWNSMDKPNDRPLTAPNGKPVYLFNCGGWLVERGEDGRDEFRGAEVFLYETGKGMTSVSVNLIAAKGAF